MEGWALSVSCIRGTIGRRGTVNTRAWGEKIFLIQRLLVEILGDERSEEATKGSKKERTSYHYLPS